MFWEISEAKKKAVAIAVFLIALWSIGSVSSCIVAPIDLEGLPCTDRGECEKGYKCYVVPGEKGGRCLKPNNKFKLYVPKKGGDSGGEQGTGGEGAGGSERGGRDGGAG